MRDDRFTGESCAMTRAMATLGSKWKPIIIHTINTRKVRFGQLNALIPLITRKVLTEQLKELEEDGILFRESFSELPPRVEYSLTEKGQALLPILASVCEWNARFENTHACSLGKAHYKVDAIE
ncbi:winged helix-turn-helix transcriptional regulator [Adhaeribacter pallidiroseus]|uniref:Putative HTH-type transcriptional regulator n=1 Tax=Adhaeribacter pallidiroseus TaxID=2072847 RepID=A0A369QFA6_9BACT|nr:helix-turn-helix domain-containing protein [Adhaeribacter pallidiroseus]RDC63593.1 putative HTH-type transcriptional regulator [Adhaeribacter pallidiroseus]